MDSQQKSLIIDVVNDMSQTFLSFHGQTTLLEVYQSFTQS